METMFDKIPPSYLAVALSFASVCNAYDAKKTTTTTTKKTQKKKNNKKHDVTQAYVQ